MKKIFLSQISKTSLEYETLFERAPVQSTELLAQMQALFQEVKTSGLVGIADYYSQKYGLNITELQVSSEEFQQAREEVSEAFVQACEQAIRNIILVCEKQYQRFQIADVCELEDGEVQVWREYAAIASVGLYVPGGKADYPSSVLMNVIPALVAGVPNIMIATPMNEYGKIPASILVACSLLGISNVWKIGGPRAIAALSYGLTGQKALKICGPGNRYVTAAKLYASIAEGVAIDSPAGPSEVMVLADQTANPVWVAADLLADSEHAEDSASVLVTDDESFANKVSEQIYQLLPQFFTHKNIEASIEAYGLIVVTKDLSDAIEFANQYAPEHIHIQTQNASDIASKIKTAGSVFVGNYASKSAGDYLTGANHVLPTSGSAHVYSALGVDDFLRATEYQYVSKQGLLTMSSAICTFAAIERLPAHGFATECRFSD